MGVAFPADAPLAVHRADLAADLMFAADFGLDVLRAFAALPVPRHEAETFGLAGSPSVKKSVRWRRGGACRCASTTVGAHEAPHRRARSFGWNASTAPSDGIR